MSETDSSSSRPPEALPGQAEVTIDPRLREDAALEDANTALEDANTALEDANTALEDANTALEDANTALEDANTAPPAGVHSQPNLRSQQGVDAGPLCDDSRVGRQPMGVTATEMVLLSSSVGCERGVGPTGGEGGEGDALRPAEEWNPSPPPPTARSVWQEQYQGEFTCLGMFSIHVYVHVSFFFFFFFFVILIMILLHMYLQFYTHTHAHILYWQNIKCDYIAMACVVGLSIYLSIYLSN